MQFSVLVAVPWSKLKGVCSIFETIAKKMVRRRIKKVKDIKNIVQIKKVVKKLNRMKRTFSCGV